VGDNGYKTPYYVIRSGLPGPVVVITGGMHGNEPAGSLAAWGFTTYSVRQGTLIVIPEINRLGLQANQRTGAYPRDPNRCYPQTAGGSATDRLSRAIWALVKDEKATWVMDLHEGYSYHKIDKSSVGQSIIHYAGTASQHTERNKVVNAMIKAANQLVSSSNHEFSHLHNPISGSLARAAGQFLGASGMTLETCKKQTLSLRIRQHEAMVRTALEELGML
jgi:predicted deacylase